MEAEKFQRQLKQDEAKIESLLEKLEEKLESLPPPMPKVSIITLTDGPDGLKETQNDFLPNSFAHNFARLMAGWREEDAKLAAEEEKEKQKTNKAKEQKEYAPKRERTAFFMSMEP